MKEGVAYREELAKVLALEGRKGYTDRAVIGGLDRYLLRWLTRSKGSLADAKLGQEIACLSSFPYASRDRRQRASWVEQVLSFLSRDGEEALTSSQSGRFLASPAQFESLDAPVTTLEGISPRLAARLEGMGLKTRRHMLYFFPRRYNDFSAVRKIDQLEVGKEQTVVVTLWEVSERPFGRSMRGTEAIIGDETGNMRAVWFNQPYLARTLGEAARQGRRVVISGKVGLFQGRKVFEAPEYELLDKGELLHTGRLVPVYPLIHGLFPRTLRRLMKGLVDRSAATFLEYLPQSVRERNELLPLGAALSRIHFPESWDAQQRASRRLAFDELFLLQVGMLRRKRLWQESLPAHPLRVDEDLVWAFRHSLPFALTSAQEQAAAEILGDLSRPRPMARLLQGEVGSGKTVVATEALLVAVANGYQGVLMAPTEILAEQHFHTLCSLLGMKRKDADGLALCALPFLPQPVKLGLLTGSLKGKETLRKLIAEGELDLAVGTHALIQEGVEFRALGLAIIDEQHRFGVLQRSALRQKGFNPHLLVMTATPIPRTLALTFFGDLDVSLIDELPPGRHEIVTRRLSAEEREEAYQFIRREVQAERQAFIICPLVEGSDKVAAKAATLEFQRLSKEIFPDLRLGLLHGRMKAASKEQVMRAFKEGGIDILVSTAVVEVGIDVPNASVMLVEGADRFGLAQLHQFRGRVGRGGEQSYCLLLADSPSSEAGERLAALERTQNGLKLAEEDLRLRGPGELLGTRQSGDIPVLRLASLADLPAVELARKEAVGLLEADPALAKPEHRLLAEEVSHLLQERWPAWETVD